MTWTARFGAASRPCHAGLRPTYIASLPRHWRQCQRRARRRLYQRYCAYLPRLERVIEEEPRRHVRAGEAEPRRRDSHKRIRWLAGDGEHEVLAHLLDR